jgi:hypothetical protein
MRWIAVAALLPLAAMPAAAADSPCNPFCNILPPVTNESISLCRTLTKDADKALADTLGEDSLKEGCESVKETATSDCKTLTAPVDRADNETPVPDASHEACKVVELVNLPGCNALGGKENLPRDTPIDVSEACSLPSDATAPAEALWEDAWGALWNGMPS